MAWRFYPLAEFSDFGVLVAPRGKTKPARFLTLKEAKTLRNVGRAV